MEFTYISLQVLFICLKCNSIYGAFESQNKNSYGLFNFIVSTLNESETTVTVSYHSTYTYQEIGITSSEIDRYLAQDETIQFLSQFPYMYQRDIIRKQLMHCPYTKLCGFSFNLTNKWLSCCKECSCNLSICVKYKTCCPDVLFTYANSLKTQPVIQDLPKLLGNHHVHKDCISLQQPNNYFAESFSAYGTASCPVGTAIELQTKCSRKYYNAHDIMEIDDMVPVLHKDTNQLYRNKHCAFCNDVSRDKIKPLNKTLRCQERTHLTTEKEILNAIYIDKFCQISFAVEPVLELCDAAKYDCDSSGTFYETACSLYRSPILVNGMYFQNIFCSFCNNVFNTTLSCVPDIYQRSEGFPFSGLMHVISKSNENSNLEGQDECEEYQLYDSLLGICKIMWCSRISTLENGTCVDLNENLVNVTYSAFIRMKPVDFQNTNDALLDINHVASFVAKLLEGSELCGFQTVIKTNEIVNATNATVLQGSDVSYIDAMARYHVTEIHDPRTITEKLFHLHNSLHSFVVNDRNESFTLKFQLVDGNDVAFETVDSSYVSDTLPALPEKLSEFEFEHMQHLTYRFSSYCQYQWYDLHVLELTSCPKIYIDLNDVPWKRFEDEILFTDESFKLSRFQYYFVNEDHIMICADRYKDYLSIISLPKTSNLLSAESVVSISLISLSILALCITFFTYCFVPKLRQSIPGKNNLSLITSLLCAQCLYLIVSVSGFEENYTVCYVLGLFVHFSWLVALFWMNICTYHMFRVLAKTKILSRSSGRKRLLLYHLYAILMAAILVSINIGISYNINGNYGYGGTNCYISTQQLLIWTFGIPASFIVLSNLLMFVIVVVKIKRSPSVQKNVKNERNDIIIFAKLSTITGATWVFGLLYMFTNSIVLSYIFIVLNASQGIFIMLSFIVNRRVYDLLRGKVLGLNVSSSGGEQTATHTM